MAYGESSLENKVHRNQENREAQPAAGNDVVNFFGEGFAGFSFSSAIGFSKGSVYEAVLGIHYGVFRTVAELPLYCFCLAVSDG